MKARNTLTGPLLMIATALAVTGIFTSCDHAQIMNLQATGEKNTSVVLYGNRALTGKKTAGDTGKLVIRVPQEATTSRKFYFGMGNWNDAALEALINNIDSIVITNSSGIERLNNKIALRAYLQAHCDGFAHNELNLQAK